MTLETGKHNKSLRQCAFTLIELVMVMVLLVIAVCMIVPRMSTFVRGRALDSEARRMMALLHAGQSRAVSEGMPIVLWVDAKQGTFGLQEESPPKGGDPKAEQLSVSDSVGIDLVTAGSLGGTTFKNLPAIRFLPDGTIDENSPKTVQLKQDSQEMWLVELQNRTGYEVSDSPK